KRSGRAAGSFDCIAIFAVGRVNPRYVHVSRRIGERLNIGGSIEGFNGVEMEIDDRLIGIQTTRCASEPEITFAAAQNSGNVHLVIDGERLGGIGGVRYGLRQRLRLRVVCDRDVIDGADIRGGCVFTAVQVDSRRAEVDARIVNGAIDVKSRLIDVGV